MNHVLANYAQDPEGFEHNTALFLHRTPDLKENPELQSSFTWGTEVPFDQFIRDQLNPEQRESHLSTWHDGSEAPVASKDLEAGFVLGACAGIISVENVVGLTRQVLGDPNRDPVQLEQIKLAFLSQHEDVLAQKRWKETWEDHDQDSRKVFFDVNGRRMSVDPFPHKDVLTRLEQSSESNVARYVAKIQGLPPVLLLATTRPVNQGEALSVNTFSHQEPASCWGSGNLLATNFDGNRFDESYFELCHKKKPSIDETDNTPKEASEGVTSEESATEAAGSGDAAADAPQSKTAQS